MTIKPISSTELSAIEANPLTALDAAHEMLAAIANGDNFESGDFLKRMYAVKAAIKNAATIQKANLTQRRGEYVTPHVSSQIIETHQIEYDDAYALAGNMLRVLSAHRLASSMVSIETEEGESVSGFDLREEELTDGSKVHTLVITTL